MEILTITELSTKLGISDSAIYVWVQKGCPYVKTEFGKRFIEAEVRKWHKENLRQVRKFALKEGVC